MWMQILKENYFLVLKFFGKLLCMVEIMWVCESTWKLNFIKSKCRSSISDETSAIEFRCSVSVKYTPVC